jgi:UDP-GlcNAc:undecaprenyl-phosphate/decaprenyl-phosphate GlcNAc-1-phosphate transferase
VALAIVLALTVYGELRSITRSIERVPPLRWLDELGRPQDAA